MENRERNYLIFGALAGAAAGYWLNSNRGREVRTQVADASMEQVDKVKTYVTEEADSIKDHAGQLIERSIELAKEAMNNVQAETNDVSSNMSDSFSKGVAKAKKAIAELEHQLEKESADS